MKHNRMEFTLSVSFFSMVTSLIHCIEFYSRTGSSKKRVILRDVKKNLDMTHIYKVSYIALAM